MKRVFNFETDKYEMSVEVELTDNGVFIASGEIWERPRTMVEAGQCLDSIKNILKDTNDTYSKIYKYWKQYHLNDMHAECEHQNKLGWLDIAKQSVRIYTYTLKSEICSERRRIEDKAMKLLKNGNSVKLTKEELEIINLPYEIKTPNETLSEDIKDYYKFKEFEEKLLGWLHENEHSNGILGKKCPVCGYEYGTNWIKFDIPENDINDIINMLKGE